MNTPAKALKEMALTDLILPQASLTNIVEDDELQDKLTAYAKTTDVNEKISELSTTIDQNFVGSGQYDYLAGLIDSINDSIQDMTQQLAQLQTIQEDLQNVKIRLDGVEARLDEVETRLPEQTPDESTLPNDIVVQPNDDEDDDNDDEQTPSSDDQNQDNTEQTPPPVATRRKAK